MGRTPEPVGRPQTADPVRTSPRVRLVEQELVWRFSRSGGPGGQHVNTSDTRVSLSLDLATTRSLSAPERERALRRLAGHLVGTVYTVTVEDFRSQARNRDTARERLAVRLSLAAAPEPRARRATRPTRGSAERRLAAKKRRSQVKRMRGRGADD
ncbi:alternative ribosome rescue aminoacyl-tRNA hydrolase ArfB [Streptomonospora nanhaiensis]|uniref:Ribosome-associated protein n=1 Tax=Streptomonospora nanhaiensis TaxID=1323731 RepID=A0A853BHI3_9ACTN|nr:alternative ribosome rescue aminoacyl-tRNA hydrolase ArfB [Streptomonospora nanhaiensis]MBV2365230.1 aminoacyl-tRNA hydrolase [Streptomonospora nanhaiensis]MBX9390233.1 aminoacyl-tRNA hydrolase [Streptomonospora nanhaiensis]NYI94763.1 ribosome-associated protein [Streptomonospora nanhaiensis]